jgi:TolA-binding protein
MKTRRFCPVLSLLLLFTASAALCAGPTLSDLSARTRERAERLSRASGVTRPAEDATLATGRQYLERGEYARAVAALQEAATLYRGKPAEPAVLLALGQAYGAQKERTLAIEAYDAVLKRFPASDLADDAQFGKALLELADLPSPGDLLDAVKGFATFNPLSLDPDAIHYLLGVERGYRMDRVGQALSELEKTWSEHPTGDRAPDALLRQAVIEGFLVSERARALEHLERLAKRYGTSSEASTALVPRGFLLLLDSRVEDALACFEKVPPESAPFPQAAFLGGLARAYLLGDLAGGTPHFEALARSKDPLWRDLGHYHCALLSFASTGQTGPARTRLTSVSGSASPRLGVWRRSLEKALDRIDQAGGDADRRVQSALFWKEAGHYRRAAEELERALVQLPAGPAAARAHLELGRIYSEDLPDPARAREHLQRAGGHPVPELAVEARWRLREGGAANPTTGTAGSPILESLAAKPGVWRDRASAELARRVGGHPRQQGRLVKALLDSSGSLEERQGRLRELAELFVEQKRYEPALDLFRRLLPDDPALRNRMVRLAALREMAALERTPGAAGGPLPTASRRKLAERAVGVAEQLLAAGEREPAMALLHKAAAGEGGLHAKVKLLSLSLEDGPLELTALGRVNTLLQEKELADGDRYLLTEWKARVLEHQGIEHEKSLELYRYLVARGYRAGPLSVVLANRALQAGKPHEALTALAKVPRGAARDLAEAKARTALNDDLAARDRLTQLVSKYPEAPETREALEMLAERDGRLLEAAVCSAGASSPTTDGPSAEEVLRSLVPGEAAVLRPMLETLARSVAGGGAAREEAGSRSQGRALVGAARTSTRLLEAGSKGCISGNRPAVSRGLLDALLAACEAAGAAPSARAGLYRLRLASLAGAGAVADRIALARCLAADGKAREAFDQLEGQGPEAALEQARLLKDGLNDQARAASRLERLATDGSVPAGVRAQAAWLLAGWSRGQKGEVKALERSVEAAKGTTYAAEVHERLAELALARGDQADAARSHEAAARATGDGPAARELTLRAARDWLDAGNGEAATRLARGLLGQGADEGVPERAREILGQAGGRQQTEALDRALDRDDPENPANFATLLTMARTQARLLGRFDEAEATLAAVFEQFPGQVAGSDAGSLKDEVAVRKAIARHETLGGRALLRAGLLREDSLADFAGAARDYRRAMVEAEPKDATGLLARLYLIRLLALRLGEPARAARLLAGAEGHPAAAAYTDLLATARACCAGQEVARPVAAVGAGAAGFGASALVPALGHPAASPAKRGSSWKALGWAAAGPWQDPVLLEEALLQAAGAGTPSDEGATLALEAAEGIDPMRCITPLGADRGQLLEQASAVAATAAVRARSQVALGDWRREQGDPESALAAYELAAREAAGSETGQLASVRRASLLETEFKDVSGAAGAYETAGRVAGPYQKLASARLPLVLARKDAEEAEQELAKAPASAGAARFLATARRQARDTGQLEKAIENYRTFLRLERDGKQLTAAYREMADVLVRADRAREGIEALAKLLDRGLAGDSTADVLLRMGEILETDVGEPGEAEEFYREVQRVAPDSPQAGHASAGLKRLATAVKAAARAEEAGAEQPASSEELGAIRKKYLGAAKDPAGAAEALRAQLAVTAEPASKAELQLELARILKNDLQDYPAAAEAFARTIELLGNCDRSAELTLELGTLTSENLKDPKKAMAIYDQWMRDYYAHPKKVAVMLERARLLESALDNSQAAIDIYRNIANAHPRSGFDEQALLRIAHLSRTYFADHNGAAEAFDQIARRFPFGANAQTALLQAAQICELELGDLSRAAAFYNRLVMTYPSSSLANDARNALARIERRRR